MSKRLLSVRGRKMDPNDIVINPPEYFDFDFRNGPSASTTPVEARPSTSGVVEAQYTEPKISLRSRPKSSGGSQFPMDKRLQLTKVENGWIGVASGSPTHPPTGWSEVPWVNSLEQTHNIDGPNTTQFSSKWKKLGGLFKSRIAVTDTRLAAQIPSQDDSKLSLPMQRTRWRNHKSPLASLSHESENEVEPINIISTPEFELVATSENIEIEPTPLPVLSIEIPPTHLERYSVMFQNVDGISSLPLRTRKSKEITGIQGSSNHAQPIPSRSIPTQTNISSKMTTQYKLFPLAQTAKSDNHKQSYRMQPPVLQSDQVSAPPPSPYVEPPHSYTKLDQFESKCSNRGHVATTGFERNVLQTATSQSDRGICISSGTNHQSVVIDNEIANSISCCGPGDPTSRISPQSSPDIDYPDSARPEPLRLRRTHSDTTATSPEDTMISDPEDGPWLSTDSIRSLASSHTSADDEIFFDVKALRDSRSQDAQYEISRPESGAVQLARSISKKVKAQRLENPSLAIESDNAEPYCAQADLDDGAFYCTGPDIQVAEHMLRLSIFDEAIAEVEKLTSPSDPKQPDLIPPSVSNQQSLQVATTEHKPKPTIMLPKRLQGLAIGIPSPITEVSEEGTPTFHVVSPSSPAPRHIVNQASPRLALTPQSYNTSQFDRPPPVPEKDIKYLPVSKYAVNHKTSSLSTKPHQHLSKSNRPSKNRAVSDPTQNSSRSSESSRPALKTKSSSTDTTYQNTNTRNGVQNTHTTAEVSVARQVSLSRKTSHRILVSKAGSGNGSSKPETERQLHRKEVPQAKERDNKSDQIAVKGTVSN